jgi:hypothetical protein
MTTAVQRRRRSAEEVAPAWEVSDVSRVGTAGETNLVGVVVGTLVGIGPGGAPLVEHPFHRGAALTARSIVAVDPALVGRAVALMFERADPGRPVVMGVLQMPSGRMPSRLPAAAHAEPPADSDRAEAAATREVEVDGERVTVTAEREIVLRCGKASITLTRAGKVLIKGEFVLTQAGGVNRIRGGSVQIN